MKAEIIAVGTELLMGQIDNTNAGYISRAFPKSGVYVHYHTVVGDNPGRLKDALMLALNRVDVVVLTGGLGPTSDDLTKESVAQALDIPLVYHDEIMQEIKQYFSRLSVDKRAVVMSLNNEKQAYYPKDSLILPNHNGTAAGCLITKQIKGVQKYIILLPGPPHEMQPMFDKYVTTYFEKINNEALKSIYIKLFGIGESAMESLISEIVQQTNPTIAPYAKQGEILLRVTARYDKQKNDYESILKPTLDTINNVLGEYIFAYEDVELKDIVGAMLIEKGISISFAESCTGGMLSAMLTDIPGISAVYPGAITSYSNEVKQNLLNVPKDILDKHGAVSSQTAAAMAEGVRKTMHSDIGVSITGIAGPGGGSAKKPVGRVYIALSTDKHQECHEFTFGGNRDRVRLSSCLNALNILRKYIIEEDKR